MPTKHAKNCTSLGFFTKSERDKMNHWGNKIKRLSKENIKQWNLCGLCMKLPKDPLCCPNGDIFCKDCIYKSLLNQKERAKYQLIQYELQKQKLKLIKKIKKKKEEINQNNKFYKLEIGLVQDVRKRKPIDVIDLGKEDYGDLVTINRRTVAEDLFKQNNNLNCFWLPTLAPSTKPVKISIPNKKTYCPSCNKSLKIKKLRKIKFTTKSSEFREINQEKHICPSCMKTFTNVHKKIHLRRCGHVICLICSKKLLTKYKRCPLCSMKFKKNDLVMLAISGTGFCSSGAQVEVKKLGISFNL